MVQWVRMGQGSGEVQSEFGWRSEKNKPLWCKELGLIWG